jgi:hypothetical protein
MSLTKLSPAGSLVSDIPAGDRKIANLFLQCITPNRIAYKDRMTLAIYLDKQLIRNRVRAVLGLHLLSRIKFTRG